MTSWPLERLAAPITYAITRFLIRQWLCAAGVTVLVQGLERLPATGPAILTGNHPSVLDGFLLISVIPRRLRGFGHDQGTVAALYRGQPILHGARAVLFALVGAVPVQAGPPSCGALAANLAALEAARQWLLQGNLLAVAPEGYPNPSQALRPFGAGAVLLASELGVPIIPAVIRGSDQILRDPLQPSLRRLLRPNRAVVRAELLEPLCFSPGQFDRATLLARSAELQRRIESALRA
jgi:1-acyl-sn-glycerol-3-phosphate acyltransferase